MNDKRKDKVDRFCAWVQVVCSTGCMGLAVHSAVHGSVFGAIWGVVGSLYCAWLSSLWKREAT